MSDNQDLLAFFKNEHSILLSQYEKLFPVALASNNWNALLSYCKTQFEDNHHDKEEKFIFEAVKENSKIKSGGPLCTYFFDGHMANPSIDRAIETCKAQTGQKFAPNWSPLMKDILEKNLPLAIPGEDHEAGRILLRGIEYLLHSEEMPTKKEKIEILFNTYIEIQRTHFEREENCFFVMCKNLISPERWNQIYLEMPESYSDIRTST